MSVSVKGFYVWIYYCVSEVYKIHKHDIVGCYRASLKVAKWYFN